MDGLAIATIPVEAAAISGESVLFRTVLENRGSSAVQVPGRSSPSQFTYELRSQREGGRIYNVSAADRDRRRDLNSPAQVPFQSEMLVPGQRIEWTEDLADLMNEGFEPGIYTVTAHYAEGNAVSPRTVVTILPGRVESVSSAMSHDSLTSVIAHRREDGCVILLQRESLRDPRETVFYQRQIILFSGPISVATAIDIVPAGSGRWFAWLRDGTLTASVGWGDRTIVTSQPVQLNATQPEMLSPGFQVGDGLALFGVIDRHGDAVQLTTYVADGSDLRIHWTAELTTTGAGTAQWHCRPNGSVNVIWQEPASGRLLSREFQPHGYPVEAAPRVRMNSVPAAWSLAPAGPLAISVLGLFEGSYRYVRLGESSMVDPNPIPGLPGVVGWGFLPAEVGVNIVAATEAGIAHIKPAVMPTMPQTTVAMAKARTMRLS